MNLADLLNVDQLHEQIKARYINAIRSPDGRHTIYDYTDKATYDRVWTPETTVCRGLVVETDTDDIVARGFDKFHNLDEPGIARASRAAIADRGGDYEVWSKLDGSMVLLWWDGFRVKVKTSEYLDLHRLIMDLTPKRIHEALIAGTYESYLTQLPEEHREKAEQMARDILRISNTRTAESLAVFADLAPLLAESRKAFALEARKYPELQVYLFMLADAKPIAAAVLRNCEPA